MDFLNKYKIVHTKKIPCDLKNFDIESVLFGSGGSDNIILIARDLEINRDLFAIKIFIKSFLNDSQLVPNDVSIEMAIHKFLTKKFLLTNRTPNIIGMFGTAECPNINILLKRLNVNKMKCYTIEDRIKTKITQPFKEKVLCDLALKTNMKVIDTKYTIGITEYADFTLSDYISFRLIDLAEKTDIADIRNGLKELIYSIRTIIFQVIFTLAIIKKDYPGFSHRDLFMRNILISVEDTYTHKDYLAYHFDDKHFYVKANGPHVKINDFGASRIADVDGLNQTDAGKKVDLYKYYSVDFYSEKNDVYNFLLDLYDGQNFGSKSIMQHSRDGMPKYIVEPIIKVIGEYLDIDHVHEYITNNRELMSGKWDIAGVKILEDLVLTPTEYITTEHFSMLTELPINSNIVANYN